VKYLLDSNACVQCLRRRGNPLVPRRLAAHPPADIVLCSVVLGELRYGAERSAAPAREQALIDAFIAPYISLPFDDTAARIYAEIRAILAVSGIPIGPYDLQIAAIALANNLILVTHNTKEFSRVPGLNLEDWEIP
jgi:tRNA(fMet)-specific endonuclease VapC